MILPKEEIRANIERIRGELGGKARLLAATKTLPPDIINYAIDCGIDLIGENRVSELVEKYDYIDKSRCEIHFIGRLQTNKVKFVVGKVSLIHSVDNLRLAEEIQKRSAALGIVTDVLVEINLGSELSKGGIDLAQTEEFLQSLAGFDAIRVRGLMAIPPKCEKPDGNAELFEKIHQKYIDISAEKVDNVTIDILSAGMSDDYLCAVAHGANLVRIGSAIFGKREINK